MINVKDRLPTLLNRRLITPEGGGTPFYATITRADDPDEAGTAMNRALLMAMQGFYGNTTVFNGDGSITETNQAGDTKVTTFPSSTVIEETFTSGGVSISKRTTFGATIEEVLI
ncbi:MAG: hypothetical protein AAGU75_02440 [Bacillota bacterium]